jgi:pimeloyl-ACP methyl ester carboxylesterase
MTGHSHEGLDRIGRFHRRTMLSTAILLSSTLVFLVCGGTADAATRAAVKQATTLQLGSQTLTLCAHKPVAYCGKLGVPLDYSSPSGPDISIAFRWYPASGGSASGTVVPVEGGPGYPSIESVIYSSGSGQAGYAPMYGQLLERWNMLAVDNRGTGASTPLHCTPLQTFSGATGTAAFQRTVGECATVLNKRWHYPDHSAVHASDLFTSAPAADDLAAVLRALGLGKVDLYGDSYGSFFAQVFASRFPSMVRSLTLDSTYKSTSQDPWYRSSVESMPADFQVACSRAPACAAAEPGSVWTRIGALAGKLREAKSIAGSVPGPSGKMEKVTIDVDGLVDLVNDAAEDRQVYRDLDAAARALLLEGDPDALLRLYAQRLAVDEAYFGLPVGEYSVDLYFAVGCLDYTQLFDISATPAVRASELAAAQAALPAATYSPFTTSEWLAQDENTEAYTACEDWPSPQIAQPPVEGPLPLLPSSMPVLVLGGELDAWTPPVDVPKVLTEIGGHSRFVELANSTHVVGEGETECGSALIRSFVAHPQSLDTLDASCAPAVAAIHSVGLYPEKLAAEPPLEPSPGGSASSESLRLAAAAVQTAGDAIARFQATEAAKDRGLHGGQAIAEKGGLLLTLKHDQLIPGVQVSGTVTLTPAPLPADGQTAVANLTVVVNGMSGILTATWTTAGPQAVARVGGEVGGVSVSGTMPAP